jgi:hypothetical protein
MQDVQNKVEGSKKTVTSLSGDRPGNGGGKAGIESHISQEDREGEQQGIDIQVVKGEQIEDHLDKDDHALWEIRVQAELSARSWLKFDEQPQMPVAGN